VGVGCGIEPRIQIEKLFVIKCPHI
jgi:hypothetical protein